MARKRLRNGQKFGFVRFKGVKNVEQMEQRLNTIWIGSFKLRVFYEGNKRSEGSRKGPVIAKASEATKRSSTQEGMTKHSSYAYAVKNNVEGDCGARRSNKQDFDFCQKNFIEWVPSKKITSFLDNCLIGKVAKLTHLESISNLCSAEGLGECHIKHLGGLEILLKFESTKVMENILANEDHGLRYWIKIITRGLPRFHKPERLAWLRVIGVPVHSWEVELFKKIGQKWGVVVDTENCSLQEARSVNAGRVLVATKNIGCITDFQRVKINGQMFEEGGDSAREDSGDSGRKEGNDNRNAEWMDGDDLDDDWDESYGDSEEWKEEDDDCNGREKVRQHGGIPRNRETDRWKVVKVQITLVMVKAAIRKRKLLWIV
ncbi:hypothetical protein CTI12_AA258840 [Artemisia annua]|uniref:Uncharacterized protein n=1 Tax=Artemisia annua TaxID=35608 RepID=A0A2U1NJ04_ARTAN|nr:hypothetical protein CTI12_AA258840 [Artemisia annua]